MRVTTCKSIDVEIEAEVLFGDVLSMFDEVLQEDGGRLHRLLPMLDWITKCLARVPDESIAAMTAEARRELFERLNRQMARYSNSSM